MRPLTSLLRRLAVPLVAAGLVVIVIIVALVVFGLGRSGDDSASALPAIQIGSASAGQSDEETTSTSSTTTTTSGSEAPVTSIGQIQGTGTTLGQSGSTESTIHAGGTTVISGQIRVQQGHAGQGGPSSTGSGR